MRQSTTHVLAEASAGAAASQAAARTPARPDEAVADVVAAGEAKGEEERATVVRLAEEARAGDAETCPKRNVCVARASKNA